MKVTYTFYIRDRIEHWGHQALRAAYDDVIKHPRSESILNAIFPDLSLRYDGNPEGRGIGSTDIELLPQHNLTYGIFSDCVGMMHWFVLSFPEWDFAYEVGVVGLEGILGYCSFTTR